MTKQPPAEVTVELEAELGLRFAVTVGYYPVPGDEPSIEYYELEGENVSREELVERFGDEQVNRLDTECV